MIVLVGAIIGFIVISISAGPPLRRAAR